MIAAFFIQATVLDYMKIFNAKPDLVLMLVIFFAIFFGADIGIEAGFVCGLLKDIFSIDVFGVNIFTLAVTGLAVGILSPKFFKESKTAQILLVFAFALFSMFVHFLVSSIVSKIAYISPSEYFFELIIPVSIYTALISAVIFPMLIKTYRLKDNEEYL